MKIFNKIRRFFSSPMQIIEREGISNSEALKYARTKSEALTLAAKHINDEIKKYNSSSDRSGPI